MPFSYIPKCFFTCSIEIFKYFYMSFIFSYKFIIFSLDLFSLPINMPPASFEKNPFCIYFNIVSITFWQSLIFFSLKISVILLLNPIHHPFLNHIMLLLSIFLFEFYNDLKLKNQPY